MEFYMPSARIRMLIALLSVVTLAWHACAVAAAVDSNTLLESLGLSQYSTTYRSAEGKELSRDDFFALVAHGGSFSIEKDPQAHTATLIINAADKKQLEPVLAVKPGERMPAIVRADVNGVARRLSGARKPLLISFFFAECVPCINEVPELNDIAKAHPDLDVVAVTFDPAAEARQFITMRGLEWPVIADADDYIKRVGVRTFPTLALVSENGRLVAFRTGGELSLNGSATQPKLDAWVRETLQNLPR
jgi:thiol-disulfide isomerase/thioredoxin